MLPKFAAVNGLDFDYCWLESVVNLEETLKLNNAAYHHSCSSKYNQRMLTRAIDREDKARKTNKDDINTSMEVSSPPCKRRSGVLRKEPQKMIRCFCRLEEFTGEGQPNLTLEPKLQVQEFRHCHHHIRKLSHYLCLSRSICLRLFVNGYFTLYYL